MLIAIVLVGGGGSFFLFSRLRRQGEDPRSPPEGAPQDQVVLQGQPSWEELDDARRDGWDSEVVAAKVSAQWNVLGKLLVRLQPAAAPDLKGLVTEEFSSADLRPRDLKTAFEDGLLQVERGKAGELAEGKTGGLSPKAATGPERAARALNEVAGPFRHASEARFELKVVDVQKGEGAVTTRQYFSISGQTGDGYLEEHSVWTARWALEGAQGSAPGTSGGVPRLSWIQGGDFERVRRSTPRALLADSTAAVLGACPSWKGQLLHGLNHWLLRIQDNRFFDLLGTPGVAVGDVNGDGLDDLYLCQEGGLPNLLFLQNADGTATDAAEASGANWIESSRSALLADLDNDRNQDLVTAILGNLVLAKGDGKGHFAVQAVLPTSEDTMSLSAADFDGDGDLDLYVCAYKQDDLTQDAGVLSIGAAGDFVYHDANNGAKNLLFRNDIASGGGWSFRDVTEEVGLDVNNRRFSFAAAWEDFDNDGDQDLYVANDFGRNVLYRNETLKGGPARFVEIAASAGAENNASGMSVTWGDFDRDGWMDLYVSNMFSSAGSRITGQPGFKADASEEVRARLKRFARGNTLLRSLGGAAFTDISEEAGVTMGRWAWSSNFFDINNDGWDDLVVANGYITTEDPGDL
jgi:hypothetical protein